MRRPYCVPDRLCKDESPDFGRYPKWSGASRCLQKNQCVNNSPRQEIGRTTRAKRYCHVRLGSTASWETLLTVSVRYGRAELRAVGCQRGHLKRLILDVYACTACRSSSCIGRAANGRPLPLHRVSGLHRAIERYQPAPLDPWPPARSGERVAVGKRLVASFTGTVHDVRRSVSRRAATYRTNHDAGYRSLSTLIGTPSGPRTRPPPHTERRPPGSRPCDQGVSRAGSRAPLR